MRILDATGLRFTQIEKIRVRSAFAESHAFARFYRPTNATEAFNSLRYCIAAAAHDGRFGFEQLDSTRFQDKKILAFARDRIEIIADRQLERLRPQKWPGAVEVLAKDGRCYRTRVDYHVGHMHNPLSRQQVEEKFFRMAALLGARRVEAIARLVDGFEDIREPAKLTQLLQAKV
jgi:2-methylcitrate dehydratase PrpD